jgi:hypothetical protein
VPGTPNRGARYLPFLRRSRTEPARGFTFLNSEQLAPERTVLCPEVTGRSPYLVEVVDVATGAVPHRFDTA